MSHCGKIPDFVIKSSDTLPTFDATLLDGGVAFDLTGYTVTLHLRDRATNVQTSFVMAIVLATAGTVTYAWLAGDTDIAGEYDAEIEAVQGANRRTFPDEDFLLFVFSADIT